MIEISEYLWETLYVLKCVYDHDPEANVLHCYSDVAVDGDYVYDLAHEAIGAFFADTREYVNEEKEVTAVVIYDTIITDYWKLCDAYEERCGIAPQENTYRKEMERALQSALDIPDYSFDAWWSADTKKKNGCKLVLLYSYEFYGYYWLPHALGEAYDAFAYQTERIRKALAQDDQKEAVS